MSLSETERIHADYEQAKNEALRAERAAHEALRDAINSGLVHETGDILAPEGAIFANHIHEGLVSLEDVLSGEVTKASDFLKSEEPAAEEEAERLKAEAEAAAKAEEERLAAEADAEAKAAEKAAKAEAEKLAKEAEAELEKVDPDAAPADAEQAAPKKGKKA